MAAGTSALGWLLLAGLGTMPSGSRTFCGAMAASLAVLAVGLVRRWVLAAVLGLVLGSVGVLFGLMALLAVGDDAYEHVPQELDAYVPTVVVLLGAALLCGSAASVPPAGRPGRWVAVVALVVGSVLVGVGVHWLLEVHAPPNPTTGAANSTWDCGSVYSNGSVARSGRNECADLLVEARESGRLAVAVGGIVAVAGVGLAVSQFGWARCWPVVALGAGLVSLAAAAWFLFLPLSSGGCNSLFAGTGEDGIGCGELRGALGVVTGALFLAGVALLGTGLFGVTGRALGTLRRGPRLGAGAHDGGPTPQATA